MIAVYHLNAGSTGAEERALREAIAQSRELDWAATPAQADVFIVTGPIPQGVRPALLAVWRDYINERAPLIALGRASIDGYPFGRGGVTEIPELRVSAKIDGDPPTIAAIQSGIVQAMQARPSH
jgi:Ni,Fe-hydrogenase III small subunit